MALLITPNMPSVKAVSRPPAFATSNAIWFLIPRPLALKPTVVGTTTAGDTEAVMAPRWTPGGKMLNNIFYDLSFVYKYVSSLRFIHVFRNKYLSYTNVTF